RGGPRSRLLVHDRRPGRADQGELAPDLILLVGEPFDVLAQPPPGGWRQLVDIGAARPPEQQVEQTHGTTILRRCGTAGPCTPGTGAPGPGPRSAPPTRGTSRWPRCPRTGADRRCRTPR